MNDSAPDDYSILNDPAVLRMINAPDFITKNAERDVARLAFDLEEDHPGEGIEMVEELIKERDQLRALLKESRAYVDYGERSRFVCVPAGTKPQDIRADADSLLAEIDEVLK